MRPRSLIAIAALALAMPVAITQAAPRGGGVDDSASRKVEAAFSFDGPGVVVSPVEGQVGAYTLAQRLWSKTQRVHWFTLGPPSRVGSMAVGRFAAFLAARASADAATAPVVHISYLQGGVVRDFLGTVSAADADLGSARAPVHRATLAPIGRDRIRQIAARPGLLSTIAARCLTRECGALLGGHASNARGGIDQPQPVGNCAGKPKSCLGQEIYAALSLRELDDPGLIRPGGGETFP